MDPAIASILIYVTKINTGYVCLLNNFNNAINIFVNQTSVNAVLSYYATTCSSDSNLNSCIQLLQDTTVQGRLTKLALTIMNPFTSQVTQLVRDIINEVFDDTSLTNAQIKKYVKRFKNLSADSKNGVIAEIPSTKLILKKGGTYYQAYQNGLATSTYIFGSAKPNAKQRTKANNALKKACDYLHNYFFQIFDFLIDWVDSYSISTSVSTNISSVASITASSAALSAVAKSFLNTSSTQEKIDEIFTTCYSI